MIYFITKAKNSYGLISFLNTWGRSLKKQQKHLPIEKLVRKKKLFSGTYILTDFDLLSKTQIETLSRIYSELNKQPQHFKLLNNPAVSINRLSFLNKLYKNQLNDFRCFHSSKLPKEIIFPVFIRKGIGHDGKITDLINTDEKLHELIEKFETEGYSRSNLLVTEFIETSDNNEIFRKYSAFLVDDIIVPRHIFFSKKWMIKSVDLVSKEFIEEELNYIKNNPHENELKRIFAFAGMNYGRIDYAVKNNKLVIWEINSNPMIASSSSLKKSKRKIIHDIFAEKFISAFLKLDIINRDHSCINSLNIEGIITEKKINNHFYFNPLTYWISRIFYNIKSILLYNFYTIKNAFRN